MMDNESGKEPDQEPGRDGRKGFWRRLRDRFKTKAQRPDPHEPQPEQADEATGPRHEPESTNAPPIDAEPTHPEPTTGKPLKQETGQETDQDTTPRDAQGVAGHKQPPESNPVEPTPTDPGPAEQREPSVLSTSELHTDNVGRVYAGSLLELSQEQGAVDEIAEQVQGLLPMIAEGGELHRLLTNPAIADAERGTIVQHVFEGKVHPTLYKLLRVLGDKGRLGSLPQVAAGYLLAVAELRGQVEVIAYVARPLDESESVRVAEQVGQALGKTVNLTQKVDESLIGGMKIKIGDRLIDASVASQLRGMRNKMVAAGRS